MSLMQRALEKAEREGRVPSWTPHGREEIRRDVVDLYPANAKSHSLSAVDVPAWESEAASEAISSLLVASKAPDSPAADQFRLLRSRVEARAADMRTQLILVTSARLGEGKTTTSANLAITMAQDPQQSVLLIDGDLRRSCVAGLFGVRTEPGLIDVLMGSATLDEALVRSPAQHLMLLPAGASPGRSSEVLASSMLRQVIDGLRTRFTRIIVDTPPLILAETHELARIADGLLVVVRAGITPRPALDRALAAVDRDKVMGFVLNGVDEVTDYYGYPGAERDDPQP